MKVTCSLCSHPASKYKQLDGSVVSYCEDHARQKGYCYKCHFFSQKLLNKQKPYYAAGICPKCFDSQDF